MNAIPSHRPVTQLPLEEAIRLAKESGAIPLTASPSSAIRSRKAHAEPLIDGVTVDEVDLQDYGRHTKEKRDRMVKGSELKEREPGLGDEIFVASMVVIPLSALFLLLDILAHKQYNRHPPSSAYIYRLLSALPTIAVLIFLSSRYINHILTKPLLMIVSVACGGRLLWLVNKSSFVVVMDQAPPVGTLWILSIVQLPLGRCLISLGIMLAWCWWAGMKFRP